MIIVRGSCVSWQRRGAKRARAPVCARPAPFAATRLAPPPNTAQHRPAPPSTAQHRTARDVNTMDPSAGMATTSRSRRKEDDKKPKRKPSPAKQNEDKLRLPDPSDAALDNLRTAFGLLDRDRDGHVTAAELQFMLRNLGIEVRDELIADLIQDASRTGNGLIDENEFMQWVSKMQALQGALTGAGAAPAQDSEEEITKDLLAAFRVFDRDRNGYITRDELRSALEMIGEPVTDAQLGQVIALADIDHDGRIDYEEFVKMLL